MIYITLIFKYNLVMNKKTIYFISGASGVGKTSVIKHLKGILPENYEVHDFDETGVPDNADSVWRKQRSNEWIKEGIEKLFNKQGFVVCGVSHPEEIESFKKIFTSTNIEMILLTAKDSVIRERLMKRNRDKKTKEDLERAAGKIDKFIEDSINFSYVLKDLCEKYNYSIIDTTFISPEEVSNKLKELIV